MYLLGFSCFHQETRDVRSRCVYDIWSTLDNGLREIILADCGMFSVAENPRAFVYAFKPSRVPIALPTSSGLGDFKRQPARSLMLQLQPE